MSLRTISVAGELQAEGLLEEAKHYDKSAYMYRESDEEGGHYVVCYRWPLHTDAEMRHMRD